MMAQKRTLDSFFTPTAKKPRAAQDKPEEPVRDPCCGQRILTHLRQKSFTTHPNYPIPILELPLAISQELASLPARPGKVVNDQPDLDLLYFEPYIPPYIANDLFKFLRTELPFYRVEYKITRGGFSTDIRTPR